MRYLEEIAALAASQGKRQKAFHWLIRLGAPGLLATSFLDASIIPLVIPGSTDLLLLWLISHGGSPWLTVPCAVAGSLAGGWTTWRLGKKGGQAAIQRYVPRRLQKRVLEWSRHRPVLVVFIPAILPPPIPLWPFLLAAGALGVPWRRFLAAFGAGRVLRYGLEGWLAIAYGRYILHLWSATLDKWGPPVLWAFIALSVAGCAWGVMKIRRASRHGHAAGSLHPSHAK